MLRPDSRPVFSTNDTVNELSRSPLVSIVIPCFNAEPFVEEAVESALSQSYPHVEVIAVDDASTDGTLEVLKRFGARIRLERQERNLGPGAARNLGLALARGEFVQFLDADDLLRPGKIEACLKEFGPDTDMVFSENEYFLHGPAGRRAGPRLAAQARALVRDRPMSWEPDHCAEYVLRREVQTAMPLHRTTLLRRAGGFHETLWNLEDVELHFRLAITGARVRKVERVLVDCRHHGNPSRLRRRAGRFLVGLRALDEMMRRLTEAGRAAERRLGAALADRYAAVGRKLLWEGHEAEAARAFQTARALSPVPRPTRVPVYNSVSRVLGLERTERLRMSLWRSMCPLEPLGPRCG